MIYLARRVRNRRGGRFASLLTASIFLIVSLILGWFLVLPGWRARLFGVQTQGIVTSLADCSSDSGGDTGGAVVLPIAHQLIDIQNNVQPTVQFTDRQGNRYELEDSICGSYGIGETVALWYLPDDPTTFSLQNDTSTLLPVTLLVAAFMLIALLLILWFLLRPLLLLGISSLLARRGNAFVGSPPQMGYSQMGGSQISSTGGSGNFRIGEAVPVEGRWEITLNNAYPSQGNERAHPVPGRFYLILPLLLRNVSNEPLYPRQATFRLSDTAGLDYPQVRALEDPLPDLLQPGDLFSLTLAYDVPGTLHHCKLSFYSSSSFLSQADWVISV